jgi:hypothetical protein
MAGLPPNTQRQDEPNEFPCVGPFGGIQSEAPLERIEMLGFADAVNVIFRKGAVWARPQLYQQLPALDGPIVGVADFFDVQGERHQVVMTPTSMYVWDGGAQTFDLLTGALTGSASQLFTSTVVADKLLFSQGQDPVQVWDGLTPGFAPVSVNAVPAKFLFELGFHLIACNTIESGVSAPQRVRWTGADDPTDWTSFNAGQVDLFNDLGPITGGVKLYQAGYVFQFWGITQMVPTGIGTAPFQFVPLGSKAKGNCIPYSLASFGEDIACYVGRNNVYQFDGNYSTPIGDARLDGSRYRTGARKRILADLQGADFGKVFGYLSTSINGQDYFAYWLFIPNLNEAWVYHFDENSWTRETFGTVVPTIAGNFFRDQTPRIMDLIGPISAQQWTPASLTSGSPFDNMLIGLDSGVPAYIDFTGTSEIPWSISSGKGFFGDYRHRKTVKAVRVVIEDVAPGFTCTLTLTNNKGYSQTQTIGPIGTGSGNTLVIQVPFQPVVSGTHIDWELDGALANGVSPALYLTEITSIYDVGGDIRVGDN